MTASSEESQGRTRSLAWTSSSYFAEGLPWSILHQIASEYLTAIGARPVLVGFTSWLNAATLFKVVWSPIVELFGTLRSWMIWMQALMGALVGVLALVAHSLATAAGAEVDTTTVWVCLVAVGVLSATHDIACDGYYMAVLSKERQASFSGVRVAAFRAAMMVGSSGLVFLGGAINWLAAFGTAAALLGGLALFHAWFLPRERPVKVAVSQADKALRIKDSYLSFLKQPQVVWVILFLLSYKMADVLMFSMSKVLFARDLFVPTDLRGVLNAFSIGASILGAALGGALIARWSLKRTLFGITFMMAITEPLFVVLAAFAPELAIAPAQIATMAEVDWGVAWWRVGAVGAVVVTEQIFGGMATAAQMVFIMRRCSDQHRAAHYAFATAVYALPQTLVGGLSGWLYEGAGAVGYFWVVSLITLPAVYLCRKVPTD